MNFETTDKELLLEVNKIKLNEVLDKEKRSKIH